MNEVMTETEAAQYLRLSTKTLQRRRRNGQISFVRDGGIRYLRADLETYLSARRTAAAVPPPPAKKPKYRKSEDRFEKNRQAMLELI